MLYFSFLSDNPFKVIRRGKIFATFFFPIVLHAKEKYGAHSTNLHSKVQLPQTTQFFGNSNVRNIDQHPF